jgi:MFS family permease
MFAVPFGRISDIYGMKRIFNYGIIIFTIASFFISSFTICRVSDCIQDPSGNRRCNGICNGSCNYNIGLSTSRKR